MTEPRLIMQNTFTYELPNTDGYFGEYGGSFIPPELQEIITGISNAYDEITRDKTFLAELTSLYQHYVGRPSPVFHAQRLSEKYGTPIYLKREDLNHTGAHKINHCLGEALLAKKMGKTKLIAETGAGQHGVALATAAALLGMECDIYMGEVDIVKEHPNVVRMQILGAQVIPVTHGRKTLKEAVDAAFEAYLGDPINQFYAIGSVVGPHPFPRMVRDFQSIVGNEARVQMLEMTGQLPDHIVACIGGGSNAMGIFSAFLEDGNVTLHGVELNAERVHRDQAIGVALPTRILRRVGTPVTPVGAAVLLGLCLQVRKMIGPGDAARPIGSSTLPGKPFTTSAFGSCVRRKPCRLASRRIPSRDTSR